MQIWTTDLNVFVDSRYRDTFGLRPDLMNVGVSKEEIERVLYDRKVFSGIYKVLDIYVEYYWQSRIPFDNFTCLPACLFYRYSNNLLGVRLTTNGWPRLELSTCPVPWLAGGRSTLSNQNNDWTTGVRGSVSYRSRWTAMGRSSSSSLKSRGLGWNAPGDETLPELL